MKQYINFENSNNITTAYDPVLPVNVKTDVIQVKILVNILWKEYYQ